MTKLFTNAFASMDERDALFNEAIPMHMTESWHGAMVVDINAFSPMTKDISVASDLVAGISRHHLLAVHPDEGWRRNSQNRPIRRDGRTLEPSFRLQLDRRHDGAARRIGLGRDV